MLLMHRKTAGLQLWDSTNRYFDEVNRHTNRQRPWMARHWQRPKAVVCTSDDSRSFDAQLSVLCRQVDSRNRRRMETSAATERVQLALRRQRRRLHDGCCHQPAPVLIMDPYI